MNARNTFAYNMKKHRMANNLSQEKLAEICGLHRTYISSVERGVKNISIDNMEKIALSLGVSLQVLVVAEDE